MKLIEKAKKDSRNKKLFEELNIFKTKVEYLENNDVGWGVTFDRKINIAKIYYNKCKHPEAALAHELLHILTQLSGYKQVKLHTASELNIPKFNILMDALDNELQHHKFYRRFIALGYKKHQFYDDSDETTIYRISNSLQKYSQKNVDLIEIVPDFLTLIALGGTIEEAQKNALEELFYNLYNGKYKKQLKNIKLIIEEWSQNNSYDNTVVLQNILLETFPKPVYIWFGFDSDDKNMENGFYVDREFAITE